MRFDLDEDGQPNNQAFNWDRRLDRGMDELIGIARGVLADGCLVVQDARFLFDWLKRNEPVRQDFFGKTIYDSLRKALEDNELSAEEEDALIGLLLRFVGPSSEELPEASCYSTSLPLDDPPPVVNLAAKSFCFTGRRLRPGEESFTNTQSMKLIISLSETLAAGIGFTQQVGGRLNAPFRFDRTGIRSS